MLYRSISILPFAFLLLLGLAGADLRGADYFWVGGSGDWSEISHWATTSGGTTVHNQSPTAEDDVYFDANSFTGPNEIVTLRTDIIFCRSMRWNGITGTPTLRGLAGITISVFGSLQLSPDMTFAFDGDIRFTGSQPDNRVDFAGQPAGRNVTFAGLGSWSLNNGITASGTLGFSQGNLFTNGNPISCRFFNIGGITPRQLNLEGSTINISGSHNSASAALSVLRFSTENLDVRTTGSTILIEGTANTNILIEGNGTLAFDQVFINSPEGNSRITNRERVRGEGFSTVNFTLLETRHASIFVGEFTANTLRLSSGDTHVFSSGNTIFTDSLKAVGDCLNRISLRATNPAVPAILSSGNAQRVDFANLQSINATGGGVFTANNAIDQGGNTGWTINVIPAETLYWVGSSGEWHDPANWSLSSGGGPIGCIPTIADNVVFDVNSFSGLADTVYITSNSASCHNMTWDAPAGNPVLEGPTTYRLSITGSLQFAQNLEHRFRGDYYFASTETNNQIFTAGKPFNRHIFFGDGGQWTLNDDLFVEQYLYLNQGTLNTSNNFVSVNRLLSTTTSARQLLLGSSTVEVAGRAGASSIGLVQLTTTNLTVDASAATVIFDNTTTGRIILNGTNPAVFHTIDFRVLTAQVYNNLSAAAGPASIDSVFMSGNGVLNGDNSIDYARLSEGFTYSLAANRTQRINTLDANGSCTTGLTNIICASSDQTARLGLLPGQTFDRLHLRGIEVSSGAPAAVTNSVDERNNSGWNFTNSAARNLFWVGGSGDWYDTAHWSLTSGGAGGECVPTVADDVTFDDGSGLAGDRTISDASLKPAYCNNITWSLTNPGFELAFRISAFTVNGSLTNSSNVNMVTPSILFTGPATHTIQTNGMILKNIFFQGQGEYTIVDDFVAATLEHQTGNLQFLGASGEIKHYLANDSQAPKQLDLGNTRLTITGEDNGKIASFQVSESSQLNILSGNSQIVFTDPAAGMWLNAPVAFHNLIFSEDSGGGQVRTSVANVPDISMNQLVFRGDGDLLLPIITDSLQCASGKSYRFAAGLTQQINRFWRILGNNCTPISLLSTIPETPAIVSMPATAKVLANSVQMRDITAVGGAEFRAGVLSTNINNSNDGWIFESASSFLDVGFLGEDQGLCLLNSLELDANNFSPNESYRWQDGSTNPTFTVTSPGLYSVRVTFLSNCSIQDTVRVIDESSFSVMLPADTVVCAGDSLTIEATAELSGVDYLWQDGSTLSRFTARQSGSYAVTASLDGCLNSDTLELTIVPLPNFSLGGDQTVCADEEIELVIADPGGGIRWNDGETTERRTFTSDAFPSVEITDQFGCTSRDSAMLTFDPLPFFDLGPDTTVCRDRPFSLRIGEEGSGSVVWPDGSTGEEFSVRNRGTFVAVLEDNGCFSQDTITIDLKDCKDFSAYLPNAFSPDGDGVNDGYAPNFDEDLGIRAYRMEIFSRWGERVFATEDPYERWDGKVGGREAPYGVYIVTIDITYEDDRGVGSDVLSGDVMLLR